MSEYRILLVEDEANLLAAIKLNLELEGYHVSTATDGKKALKMIKEERVSLVILDVMMPEMDGFQVVENIRLQNNPVPVLFLTARNTSEDRVLGLKKGKASEAELTGQIKEKAKELWEKKGRVQGKDLEIWLEAEKLVRK